MTLPPARPIHTPQHQERSATTVAWYREPWPWILMAGPAAVVVAGIVTAWIAVRSFDGLIADDYYKQGLAVNQVLARSQRAEALGLRGTLEISADAKDAITIQLRSTDNALPAQIKLALSHPTRAGLDQRLSLAATSEGVYSGRIAPLVAGRWRVIVEDAFGQWRVGGELHAPAGGEVQLRPAR